MSAYGTLHSVPSFFKGGEGVVCIIHRAHVKISLLYISHDMQRMLRFVTVTSRRPKGHLSGFKRLPFALQYATFRRAKDAGSKP